MAKKRFYTQTMLFNESGGNTHLSDLDYIHDVYRSKIIAIQSVIQKLRNDDLNQGYCFMMFDENLPEGEAYYEYPDGCIRVEKLDKHNIKIPRKVIKLLNKNETAAVREKHAING